EKRMAKKVYELANEIGVGALDLVEKLKSMGFNIRNHMASLSVEEEAKARSAYETPEKKTAPTKKAVVRKVIKREAPSSQPAAEETPVATKEAQEDTPEVKTSEVSPAAESPVEASTESPDEKPKVVTVKRKTKAQK